MATSTEASNPVFEATGSGDIMNAASVAGVAILLILVIVALFALAVLIDCKGQNFLDKKMQSVRKTRAKPKRGETSYRETEQEDAGFTNHMEGPATSNPPASAIFDIV